MAYRVTLALRNGTTRTTKVTERTEALALVHDAFLSGAEGAWQPKTQRLGMWFQADDVVTGEARPCK